MKELIMDIQNFHKEMEIDRSELVRRRIQDELNQSFWKMFQRMLMVGSIIVTISTGLFSHFIGEMLYELRVKTYTAIAQQDLWEVKFRQSADKINNALDPLELYVRKLQEKGRQ